MRVMTASEASRSFKAVLDEAERGETIVVTRGGRRVAKIMPTEQENGTAVLDVLRRWQGKLPDDDEFESLVGDARVVAGREPDTDPWIE